MRKIIFSLIFVILFSSIISADIIINEQPKEIYNLGDTIKIPVTLKALSDLSGSFEMNLLCNGHDINFYKNGITMHYGEEQKIEPSLVLTKNIIQDIMGACKIKASLINEEPQLTNEFMISDLINIQIKENETNFKPGESITIRGSATKENTQDVNGFLEVKVISEGGDEIPYLGTISNGFYSENISIDKTTKAGEYQVKLHAYERNFLGETTNQGFYEYSISIMQIPTNLEILIDNPQVKPGTKLSIKTILHDQTGENIEGFPVNIQITDKDGLKVEEIEKQTGESLETPIPYDQPPAKWNINVKSGKITNKATFEILQNKEIKTEIMNKTLIFTNIGNVPYNDTVLVKIGDKTLNVDVNLDVNENKKYALKAPDGEYVIQVLANGKPQINENVLLTGKAIDISEAKEGIVSIVRHPGVWVFIIAILGFVSFIIFKKGYKRSFFGYIPKIKKTKIKSPIKKDSLINPLHKAELSLSLKGEKQDISLVCLKIKNLKEIKNKKTPAVETLQNIINLSQEYKSAVYENQDNIFFLLAPVKTKTFKNEKSAVDFSNKIKEILIKQNKLFKQKINFGISLNYGAIIAKQEKDSLKFMSMGTLITTAKKIASISNEEILLSEKIREKLLSSVKTQKQTKEGITYYSIREIKDTEKHKKFISSFLDRIEKK